MTKDTIQKRNQTLKLAEGDLREAIKGITMSLAHYNDDAKLTKSQVLQLLQDRVTELFNGSGVYRY